MSDTRKLTIGVTINLGNSEQLHLEVSDVVESGSDAANLRTFLGSVLDGYGSNDAAVRMAIDGYCRRVLAGSASSSSSASFDAGVSDEPLPDTAETTGCSGEAGSEFPQDGVKSVDTSFDDDDDDKRVEINEDDYLRLPPAPLVEESAEEFVCSKCGATVSKLQRDVSMLFNHKILCKDCMR